MKTLRAICFDLDDTLWDLAPVIPRAERVLYEWYAASYPAVAEHYSRQDILEMRRQVAERHPELRHDLTVLRMKVLQQIAVTSGYSATMAEEAFAVFDAERNRVDLYADVLPALQLLGERFRLLSLSNGNANLEAIGIADLFVRSYNARELGVAKPDAAIFQMVCEREGLAAHDVLHVGDHPQNDIVAAQSAGLPAAWVNRKAEQWPEQDSAPEHTVTCLEDLARQLLQGVEL